MSKLTGRTSPVLVFICMKNVLMNRNSEIPLPASVAPDMALNQLTQSLLAWAGANGFAAKEVELSDFERQGLRASRKVVATSGIAVGFEVSFKVRDGAQSIACEVQPESKLSNWVFLGVIGLFFAVGIYFGFQWFPGRGRLLKSLVAFGFAIPGVLAGLLLSAPFKKGGNEGVQALTAVRQQLGV